MHHTKLPAYLREQKKYHLAHHYKNFELGFGVTSMARSSGYYTSSNISFQAKFGTTCLTPCCHPEYQTLCYSFPMLSSISTCIFQAYNVTSIIGPQWILLIILSFADFTMLAVTQSRQALAPITDIWVLRRTSLPLEFQVLEAGVGRFGLK
jgi:hypothetical protein